MGRRTAATHNIITAIFAIILVYPFSCNGGVGGVFVVAFSPSAHDVRLSYTCTSTRTRCMHKTAFYATTMNYVHGDNILSSSKDDIMNTETTTTNSSSIDYINKDGIEERLMSLSNDLNKLKSIRPPEPKADFSAPTALISAGSSYTRLWTEQTWLRHADPPHIRYRRHVGSWALSTSARKILPAVFISASYSLVMSFVLRHVHIGQYQLGALTKGASAAMAALSAPLALLLTLRANASLGRLNEARVLWGKLILRGRNLASLLTTYVMPIDPPAAILATRYISVYGWAVKALVRNESIESQREVYATMLGEEEAEWLLSQNIRPTLLIILRLRQLLSRVAMDSTNPNFFVPHSSMESAIDDLDASSGGCERLMTSPIPPTYSRHLSRIMFMYLAILPFALVSNGLPSLGSTAASALVSYVIIGVDEIGMEVENPFPLLPLQQLCSALQNVAGEQILL